MSSKAQEIVTFWFSDAVKPYWFKATPEFDAQLRDKYAALVRAARTGELDDWANTAEGALALIILLDQLPRNIHRGEPESFASDQAARSVARRALEAGFDAMVNAEQQSFFYLPYMHSEDLADQDQCVALYEAANVEENLKYARSHRDLIARFGRFPHRNSILGRESSAAELEYLASHDAFRG